MYLPNPRVYFLCGKSGWYSWKLTEVKSASPNGLRTLTPGLRWLGVGPPCTTCLFLYVNFPNL